MLKILQARLQQYMNHELPDFIVIQKVKSFGIVSRAEVGVFLEFLAFLIIH